MKAKRHSICAKLLAGVLFFITSCISIHLSAQSDSSSAKNAVKHEFTHRDSLYLAKLNTSGNLMIAGGVGLCAAGSYLIYQGVQVYKTPASQGSSDPAADVDRNHSQGTAYMIAGGVGIVGGIVLAAFGIRNKIDFKQRKRWLSLQSGLLDNGKLGAMLSF